MRRIVFFLLVLFASVSLSAPGLEAAETSDKDSAYVLLPRLYLPVPDNQTGAYRMLDIEAWLLFANPDDAKRASGVKAAIGERMKLEFIKYQWSYFEDSALGADRAKDVIRTCARMLLGSKIEIRDVLLSRMVLR